MEAQKRATLRGGLKVIDLPGERVLRAQQVVKAAPEIVSPRRLRLCAC